MIKVHDVFPATSNIAREVPNVSAEDKSQTVIFSGEIKGQGVIRVFKHLMRMFMIFKPSGRTLCWLPG